MSKSRGNVVDPWEVIDDHGADAFRWYYFTSQQPWAGYRFSAETVGEARAPVPAHALEHVRVLRPLRERRGRRARGAVARRSPLAARATDLDRWALSRLQGTIADGDRAHGRLRLHDRRARDRGLRRRALQLVRAAQRRRFWEGDPARASRRCATACSRSRSCSRRSPRSSPTRSTRTSTAASAESVHLCRLTPSPIPTLADGELEAGDGGGDAGDRARSGRAGRRPKIKVRQPLREAVVVASDAERAAIERLERRWCGPSSTSRSSSSSPRRTSWSATRVKPNYRTLGPRFGKAMPQVAAAVAALDADRRRRGDRRRAAGRDQHRRRRPRARARRPHARAAAARRATRSRPRRATRSRWSWSSTTSCAARGSPARSSTPIQNARKQSRPRSHGPDLADARRRRRAARGARGRTRTTSPARRWPPRSGSTASRPPTRSRSTVANWPSRSSAPSGGAADRAGASPATSATRSPRDGARRGRRARR